VAAEGRGSVRIEAAPLALRRGVDVFGEPGPRLALLRRLKAAFDPAGVLNPGRFAGRL
jgi:FAD/FMN-containing dehydrogenase